MRENLLVAIAELLRSDNFCSACHGPSVEGGGMHRKLRQTGNETVWLHLCGKCNQGLVYLLRAGRCPTGCSGTLGDVQDLDGVSVRICRVCGLAFRVSWYG